MHASLPLYLLYHDVDYIIFDISIFKTFKPAVTAEPCSKLLFFSLLHSFFVSPKVLIFLLNYIRHRLNLHQTCRKIFVVFTL